jgi:hypothetical protein
MTWDQLIQYSESLMMDAMHTDDEIDDADNDRKLSNAKLDGFAHLRKLETVQDSPPPTEDLPPPPPSETLEVQKSFDEDKQTEVSGERWWMSFPGFNQCHVPSPPPPIAPILRVTNEDNPKYSIL